MIHSDSSVPANPKLASDQLAIACLKKGNIAGLATLVQNYQVQAVRADLVIVHDRDLAEEVVQEAFLQVYRKIGQFDDQRPFRPWFLRIVIHTALKAANRQKRSVSMDNLEEESLSEVDDIAEWLIDPKPGPETILETTEMQETIWRALDRLTPEQRAAVVLRYFLNQNESEMILELNRPLTTIKWWLHAARKRLRVMLQVVAMNDAERQEADHES